MKRLLCDTFDKKFTFRFILIVCFSERKSEIQFHLFKILFHKMDALFISFFGLISLNFMSIGDAEELKLNCTIEDIIGTWHFLEGSRGHNSESTNCPNFTLNDGNLLL